jgi:hypothetical protein
MTLIEQYFKFIHPSFPIIAKGTFVEQVEKFYASSFVRPGRNWLGILNLILAIVSHRSQCAFLTPSAHVKAKCLKYFTRARKLCIADGAILHHSSLQQSKVSVPFTFSILAIATGNFNIPIASFYYMLSCIRAWKLCGMALRSSLAMALHLQMKIHICRLRGNPLDTMSGGLL